MPHLQVEVSESLDDDTVDAFADWMTDRYAEHMDTGEGHVGVTVHDDATVALGRADPGEPVAILTADVRARRTADQRRAFAVAVLAALEARWDIPRGNGSVVSTEHSGADVHLAEAPLDAWSAPATDEDAPPCGAGYR